jgi:hypothetical protein
MPLKVSESEYRKLARQPEPEAAARAREPTEPEYAPRAPRAPRAPLGQTHRGAITKGDENYWTFMVTALILLFIAYVAGKGELRQWIDLIFWKPAEAPKIEAGADSTKPGAAPVHTPQGDVAAGGAAWGKGSLTPPSTAIVPGGESILQHYGVWDAIKGFFGGAVAPPAPPKK